MVSQSFFFLYSAVEMYIQGHLIERISHTSIESGDFPVTLIF